jgi:hypothetical protein
LHGQHGEDVINSDEFHYKLAKGQLTTVGYIYQGVFDLALAADTQCETDAGEAQPLTATKCIVVYVGGTAYRICS